MREATAGGARATGTCGYTRPAFCLGIVLLARLLAGVVCSVFIREPSTDRVAAE